MADKTRDQFNAMIRAENAKTAKENAKFGKMMRDHVAKRDQDKKK